jgi:hypothetical protein
MKTRLKMFTTVLSVLACCAFLPQMQAGGRVQRPLMGLPAAWETPQLVGMPTF